MDYFSKLDYVFADDDVMWYSGSFPFAMITKLMSTNWWGPLCTVKTCMLT